MIEVHVSLIGPVAEEVGHEQLEYHLVPPATLDDLRELLEARHPALRVEPGVFRWLINGDEATGDAPLADGDEVQIVPRVAGGQAARKGRAKPDDGPVENRSHRKGDDAQGESKSLKKKVTSRKGRKAAGATKSATAVPDAVPTDETLEQRSRRTKKIIDELRNLYPEATCALTHGTALQLLISTILSAQSTDETVNKVTPALFARYPDAASLAAADPAEVEKLIHATGFFRQKTRSIINACRIIVERHGGEVPDAMEKLIELPGVARKTANVVLGTWFGKNEGVVVDTHIGRLSRRLALSWTARDSKDAVKIEQDLMQVLPRYEWTYTGHALIWHGRKVCTARKPRCAECTLKKLCPSAFVVNGEAEA